MLQMAWRWPKRPGADAPAWRHERNKQLRLRQRYSPQFRKYLGDELMDGSWVTKADRYEADVLRNAKAPHSPFLDRDD